MGHEIPAFRLPEVNFPEFPLPRWLTLNSPPPEVSGLKIAETTSKKLFFGRHFAESKLKNFFLTTISGNEG